MQSYRYPEIWRNRHVAAFFETRVLKEVRTLYLLSPQEYCNDVNKASSKIKFMLLKCLSTKFIG